jgi:hypothetical protein
MDFQSIEIHQQLNWVGKAMFGRKMGRRADRGLGREKKRAEFGGMPVGLLDV